MKKRTAKRSVAKPKGRQIIVSDFDDVCDSIVLGARDSALIQDASAFCGAAPTKIAQTDMGSALALRSSAPA